MPNLENAPKPSGRTVVVCVDAGQQSSRPAMRFVVKHILQPGDKLHAVTVLPFSSKTPALATEEYLGVTVDAWKKEKEANTEISNATLDAAIAEVHGLKKDVDVSKHVLEPMGGPASAGSAIVDHAAEHGASLVVVGNRGFGAFKRGLMAIAGLGSVSEFCLNHMHCPVVVVKPTYEEPKEDHVAPEILSSTSICIAVDGSSHSQDMLRWAVENIVGPHDEIHIITVCPAALESANGGLDPALMDPYPALPPVVTDAPDLDLKSSNQVLRDEADRILEQAKKTLQEGGVSQVRLRGNVLEPEGGASNVGTSLATYMNRFHFSCAVMGNRGESGLNRFMSSALLGLGSVSIDCMHKVACPVIVFKQ